MKSDLGTREGGLGLGPADRPRSATEVSESADRSRASSYETAPAGVAATSGSGAASTEQQSHETADTSEVGEPAASFFDASARWQALSGLGSLGADRSGAWLHGQFPGMQPPHNVAASGAAKINNTRAP